MKIYAPNKNANGVYASVMFTNGVGETDNPRLIKWFKNHGYNVEDNYIKDNQKDIVDPVLDKIDEILTSTAEEATTEVDLEQMTPLQLREYANKIGLGGAIKNTRNKDKLLELIRG